MIMVMMVIMVVVMVLSLCGVLRRFHAQCVGIVAETVPKYLPGLLDPATSASAAIASVTEPPAPVPVPTIASSRVPRNAAKVVRPDAAGDAAIAAATGVRSPSVRAACFVVCSRTWFSCPCSTCALVWHAGVLLMHSLLLGGPHPVTDPDTHRPCPLVSPTQVVAVPPPVIPTAGAAATAAGAGAGQVITVGGVATPASVGPVREVGGCCFVLMSPQLCSAGTPLQLSPTP